MVKDKHAKALDFMVTIMKFSDSCIGFAAETKQCSCLAKILCEDITPSDAKKFFASILYDLWNFLADVEDKEMMKGKNHQF